MRFQNSRVGQWPGAFSKTCFRIGGSGESGSEITVRGEKVQFDICQVMIHSKYLRERFPFYLT